MLVYVGVISWVYKGFIYFGVEYPVRSKLNTNFVSKLYPACQYMPVSGAIWPLAGTYSQPQLKITPVSGDICTGGLGTQHEDMYCM